MGNKKINAQLYIESIFLLILFVYVSSFEWGAGNSNRPRALKIDRLIGKCPKVKNAPFYLKNVRLHQSNNQFFIKAQVAVEEESSDDLRLEIAGTKCQSKEALDTCETVPVISLEKFCQLLMEKGTPWAPIIDSVTPKVGCPIKKGVYTTNNASVNTDNPFMKIFEGYYWKGEVRIVDKKKKKILLCAMAAAQIVYMQKKG